MGVDQSPSTITESMRRRDFTVADGRNNAIHNAYLLPLIFTRART